MIASQLDSGGTVPLVLCLRVYHLKWAGPAPADVLRFLSSPGAISIEVYAFSITNVCFFLQVVVMKKRFAAATIYPWVIV